MRVFFKKQFEKDLKKLPAKLKAQFHERLEVFINDKFNPTLNNHSVDKAFPGCWSINVSGDFRAIYLPEGEFVTFITLGTHSQLYG
jgi:addiction module RelE/StbE family toxin